MSEPVFTPLARSGSVEFTFTVSGVPALTMRARIRNPERPNAMLTLFPDQVTVCFAHIEESWELTGIEIHGARDARGRAPGVARFVPGVHEDAPQWALDLAVSVMPTKPPY